MRLTKFANRGWVGHLIEGLEERRLLSGGSIFTLLTSGSTGAATILATDDRGAALAGFTAPVLPANPVGIAESGGDLFVLNGDGTVGEYTTSGAVVNASLISGVASPSAIAVSGSDIFIGDQSGPIIEYSTSGTLVNGALTASDYYIGIAVSGSDLYVENVLNVISEYTTAGAVVNASLASIYPLNGGQLIVSGSSLYAIANNAIAQLTTAGHVVNTSEVSTFNDADSSGYAYPVGFGVTSSEIYVLNADGYLGEYTKGGALVRSTTLVTGYSDARFAGMVLIPPAAGAVTGANLEVTVQPTDAGEGQTIVSPALTVALENSDGDLLAGDNPDVSVSIVNGPEGAHLTGTTSVQAVDGAAKFLDLYVSEPGTYTLSITDGSDASVTTNSFTVSAQIGTQIFTSDRSYQSGNDLVGKFGTNGAVVKSFLDESQGSLGNPAVSGADLYVLAENSDEEGATSLNYNQGGIEEFTTNGEPINTSLISGLHDPVSMVMSGNDFFILDSDGTIGEYTTAGATVNPALVTGLEFPVDLAISGSDLFVLEEDGDLMKVGEYTTAGATVNATLASGLPSRSYSIAVMGLNLYLAEFDNNQVGEYTIGGQPINASFISVASPTVVVTHGNMLYVGSSDSNSFSQYTRAGALVQTFNSQVGTMLGLAIAEPSDSLDRITFISQPTDVLGVQTVISPAITAEEFDNDGNLASDTDPFQLSIASSGPNAAVLDGTQSVLSVNGIATFSDITVSEPGTYTLAVTGSGGSVISNSFTVTQPAAEISVATSPPSYSIGDPITITATVTGNLAAAVTPTGTVEFVADGGVFATEPVGADGTAVCTTSFIAPGMQDFQAIYSGDSIYPSVSVDSSIYETLDTPPSQGTAAFSKLTFPSSVVAGADFKSNVPLKFTNAGAVAMRGYLAAILYIEPVGEGDGGQTSLTKVQKRTTVGAGRSVAIRVPLTVLPVDLAAGNYHLMAEVIDPTGAVTFAESSQLIAVVVPVIDPKITLSAVSPALIQPGRAGVIQVALSNQGNVVAKGVEIVVTTTARDGTVIDLFSQNFRQTSVKPGRTVKFAVRIKVAKRMATGSYVPSVQVMYDGVAVNAVGAGFVVGLGI